MIYTYQELKNKYKTGYSINKAIEKEEIYKNTWKEIGFLEVYKKKIVLGNLLLTHAPTEEIGENQINIFGHIHDKPLDERFDKDNHICVSCDVIDYTPISVECIKDSKIVLH